MMPVSSDVLYILCNLLYRDAITIQIVTKLAHARDVCTYKRSLADKFPY